MESKTNPTYKQIAVLDKHQQRQMKARCNYFLGEIQKRKKLESEVENGKKKRN